MLVLLTGASGFVGSHVLESLVRRGIPTAVLLRQSSKRDFIMPLLDRIQVRTGSLGEQSSLEQALAGVTHVIHCAGLTHVRYPQEYCEGNYIGTRTMVAAVNRNAGTIKRMVFISSLAAVGPCTVGTCVTEDAQTNPVSLYGLSKLKAEQEITTHCTTDYVIVRPPAVYGPRDDGFLSLFQTVRHHIKPFFLGGIKEMSFVYVKDLAEAVINVLLHPAAGGKTFFVSGREVVSPSGFLDIIAHAMGVRAFSFPVPVQLMWPVCVVQEIGARIFNKPAILNRQKYAEFRAAAWVCDPSRIEHELGITCPTSLRDGVSETVQWYREHGWL